MDIELQKNLLHLRKAVREKDFDGIYTIDGMEGSGKSTLALQTMKILHPSLSPEDVVFTGDQFLKKVEEAKPKTGIIWDEAGSAAGTTEAMNKLQNIIRKKLQVIREKNLFICMVIPYFFGLQTYFAVSRTRFLIHVYTKGFNRGFYSFYNYREKRELYFKGKKMYWQYVVRPQFKGNFTSGYVIDEKEYRDRKRELSQEAAAEEETWQTKRNRYIFNLKELATARKIWIKHREYGEIFELAQNTITDIFNHTER